MRVLGRGAVGLLGFVAMLVVGSALVLLASLGAALGLVVAVALAPVIGLGWLVARTGRRGRPLPRLTRGAAWAASPADEVGRWA